MTAARRLFALALLLDVLGGGAALLFSSRPWQTITVARPRPLESITVQISGRSLDGALLGATLVALAGVVAVLATRGVVRQGVGLLVALSGILLGWRAIASSAAVSHSRALDLVTARRGGVGIDPGSAAIVDTHPIWPVLTVLSAAVVLAAGTVIAIFGARWSAMSSRYDAPTGAQVAGDEAMWTALDRGDDPTSRAEG
jgi:uncharacterized membrane protein (TIGR02234 family)